MQRAQAAPALPAASAGRLPSRGALRPPQPERAHLRSRPRCQQRALPRCSTHHGLLPSGGWHGALFEVLHLQRGGAYPTLGLLWVLQLPRPPSSAPTSAIKRLAASAQSPRTARLSLPAQRANRPGKTGAKWPVPFFLKMPLPLREVSMNASPWPSETQYPLIGRHLRVRWQVRECRTSGQANRFSTCSPRKGLRRVCPKTNSGKGLKPASLFRGRHLGPRKCFRFDTDASTHTIGASWVT